MSAARRDRARQVANARQRARTERRQAELERAVQCAAAVRAHLLAHNQKSRRRRVASTVRAPSSSVHPQRVWPLVHAPAAMGLVADASASVQSAFARVLAWADTHGVDVIRTAPHVAVRLAHDAPTWRCPIECVRPQNKSTAARVRALVQVLLEEYPVPRAFLNAYFDGDDEEAAWYLPIAQGKSIRDVVTWTALTKRAAHLIRSAPRELSAVQAIRWSQVRAAGGTPMLATDIATSTDLGQGPCGDEAFWPQFFAWLVAHPDYPRHRIADAARYCQRRRADSRTFSMKGRTTLRFLGDLNRERAQAKAARERVQFSSCGLAAPPMTSTAKATGFEQVWTMHEILDSKVLYDEGRVMRHCVASYARKVFGRHCAIFSLREVTLGDERRALTVEIELGHGRPTFGEVRGKFNRNPTLEERCVLIRWAQHAGVASSDAVE